MIPIARISEYGGTEKYIIIKIDDLEKYAPCCPFEKFIEAYDRVMKFIKDGRKADGKDPEPAYIAVNVDEPYSYEVIDILKKHGDWGNNNNPILSYKDAKRIGSLGTKVSHKIRN